MEARVAEALALAAALVVRGARELPAVEARDVFADFFGRSPPLLDADEASADPGRDFKYKVCENTSTGLHMAWGTPGTSSSSLLTYRFSENLIKKKDPPCCAVVVRIFNFLNTA
jgi:hypothetical protein